jgi:hypothetical protein
LVGVGCGGKLVYAEGDASATGDGAPPPPTTDASAIVDAVVVTPDTSVPPSDPCTAACAKIANQPSCAGFAMTCVSQCQNPMGLPAACLSSYNAYIACIAYVGSVTGCSNNGPNVVGCDAERAAVLSCLTPMVDAGPPTCGPDVSPKPACNACANQACCMQLQTCASSDCATLVACVVACQADGGTLQMCAQPCAQMTSTTGLQEAVQVEQCTQQDCGSQCM